ncbi:MAG: class I SAM-dependent DNA methyltransferase [Myxococcales bacterium]|nr:class I SAM-dependent DNA methyltransferase [Myxococcales bacterium]
MSVPGREASDSGFALFPLRASPSLLGSLFQEAMDPSKRRDAGAHYTSEENVLKTIDGLFMGELRADLARAGNGLEAIESILRRIRSTELLDPACGCGDFLAVAYRELRQLELDALERIRRLHPGPALERLLDGRCCLSLGSMHGIEIDPHAARIAKAALRAVDHQMNLNASEAFGRRWAGPPPRKAPNIRIGNALDLDWSSVVSKRRLTAILGNPPYVGKKKRTPEQQADMERVCGSIPGFGELDYVACWYLQAAELIRGTDIKVAFVSTNSITQGEQVGLLWRELLAKGVRIHFAHRTFRWFNDARGKAHVYCVIVGFGAKEPKERSLFDYETPDASPLRRKVRRLNPYLVEADTILLDKRAQPISKVPPVSFGSMPNDGGHLLLSDEQKRRLLRDHPRAAPLVRPFISDQEMLRGLPRWCLWLQGASPSAIASIPPVRERVEAVRSYRLESKRETTRELADRPSLFGEIRQPSGRYIVIPRHSSEQRAFIPMALFPASHIVGDSCAFVESDDPYVLGVLMSTMHMAWVRQVCGRIKSDYRYSNRIVYNNFPWPPAPETSRIDAVRAAARNVLAVRRRHHQAPLATLYDPSLMPPDLADAHRRLDRAVDACYLPRRRPGSESERLKLLFEIHRRVSSA